MLQNWTASSIASPRRTRRSRSKFTRAASLTTRCCSARNRVHSVPVRVVLVEDNEVFREALELMLGMRKEIEVVASVGDGGSALTAVLEHRPDVVLIDYRMPGLDGVETTTQLLAQLPELAVVALTASADAAQRQELLT